MNPKLKGGDYVQPRHDSYTGTHWDRGHLAPNGAMAWDEDAQRRSFTVSNSAPQKPAMNRNIWRCFEYSIREWAANSGKTHVVVGTVRGDSTISSDEDPNEVEINVPSHFLAVVYREKPKPMAIGAIVPNTGGHLDIRKFLMPVAELEKKTGYRFALPESVAEEAVDFKRWPTRIVKKELLGKLPSIDQQCPRVGS
jgi:endonuclease G